MCGCRFEQFVAGSGLDGKGKMVLGGFLWMLFRHSIFGVASFGLGRIGALLVV